MKVPAHLISLYRKTARRYNKLISKIHREPVSSYERKTFLHQLRKLFKKLRNLEAQLKIAAATGAVALMLNVNAALAQTTLPSTLGPFVKQNRFNNPLREPLFTGNDPVITAVDFDADGDTDIVMGEYYRYGGGTLRYFQNQSALYFELSGDQNPFNGIRALSPGVAPALADIDKDGDLDLFLGQNGSTTYLPGYHSGIEYYRNDGGVFSKQSGAWNETTKEGNPFDGVVLGNYVRPTFVDFDKDGDSDVVIGSYSRKGSFPTYEYHYVDYYQNNGNGTFAPGTLTMDANPGSWGSLSPSLADVDKDGDYDMVVGTYQYGSLLYYRQDTPGNFVKQNLAWDPVAKTGNPFYGFVLGSNTSPAFIDFNEDGHLDLFVSDEDNFYKYSDRIINYYKNSVDAVFTEIDGFENPFDGISVEDNASPVVMDFDGDGELDAVIGNKYSNRVGDYYSGYTYVYSSLDHYRKNTEGVYTLVPEEADLFNGREVNGIFAPSFADVDTDGDTDMISGEAYGGVAFFRNDAGVYTREIELSPFANVNVIFNSSADLIDIDNDNDFDLFMTNGYRELRYFKNEGTASEPNYFEQFMENNPLDSAADFTVLFTPFLSFPDLDHDGDLDLLFNGASSSQRSSQILYFENAGTKESPVFEAHVEDLFPDVQDRSPQMHFVDYDSDGDLDSFIGFYDGTVSYFENQNEIVETTATATTVIYDPGVDDPVVIEPNLTLSDPDDDLIVQAIVSIEDYQSGELLAFTPQEGIIGQFDSGTGRLHVSGKASAKVYETLLRSVTFEILADAGGRTKSPKATIDKNINFAVYDIDFTNPQVAVKAVTVFVNTPPVIEPEEIITPAGSVKSLNLIEITSDADGNLDSNLFSIVSQPTSSAVATIEFVSASEVNLLIDYQGITFSGVDQMTIRACDDAAACTDRILAVEVDVTSGVVVYNAVAPNSSGDNRIMRITGLPEGNKISIFNRWGDKVYEAENYQNISTGNAFQGLNQNGNALPSGVYYYTIEIPEKKLITGYLTLKQ